MPLRLVLLGLSLVVPALATAVADDGDRLSYLEGTDPYHVGRAFPRLTTPQWVGEAGVDAVVILAIDDLTDNAPRYEAYLRPILDRLKAIDGRAALSIMTCKIDPASPEARRWVAEGVNLDVHTLTHAHPLLQRGDIAESRRVYHGGVDLLARVPNNRPVAFRMPYCDSQDTVSPRFFAEVFAESSPGGHHLGIDSSVFNITTANDPALPRSLVLDAEGRERSRRYLPFPSYVNTIEDYPYPYTIGRTCWEFPCAVPSDWEAQNLRKPYNPASIADMKAALDAAVHKKGVYDLVFHPHGWIRAEQVVELIDHATTTYGKRVKFLNFRETQERIDTFLLDGLPLRAPNGRDNGVRTLDIDGDGFMDVVIGNPKRRLTRIWDPAAGDWRHSGFPIVLADPSADAATVPGVRFGIVRANGRPSILALGRDRGAWTFDGTAWASDPDLLKGLGSSPALDVLLRDVDGNGSCELIADAVYAWDNAAGQWRRRPFGLPGGVGAGVRLVDIDEDGRLDLVRSDESGSAITLFASNETGWSRAVPPGPRPLPKVARDGRDNGLWVHSRTLWWQNEDTDRFPDGVDRRSFNEFLKEVEPLGKSAEASLRSIRVRPGFRVELAASEPLLGDPIAFDWGADGSLWVVEMGDYPLGVDGKGKPGGMVKRLVDGDGDGRYDRATVFLDGLPFPTGVMPWRKGVLVASAPDILYAEDTDGDGRADVREVLFTGFTEGNQQHRINGFELGLDGWVYGANGDSGGRVRSIRTGRVVDIAGRDFRFRPDDGRFETESGRTQFGRHRDDRGDWFGDNNSVWAWQYVLADRDVARNPAVAVGDARAVFDVDSKVFPISRTLPRFNTPGSENHVTSANSPTPYRDDLFGPSFADSLFVSEPVHNLVRRIVVEPDGVASRGRLAPDEADREFLASSDNWFRPTTIRTGPDGALWIADMYRAVIEHPEWIPDDWEARLDLRAGHDKGRIYRVVPVGVPARPIARLDRLDTAGLVAAFESPNGWTRDTVERLLLHRSDPAAVAPLRALAASSKRPKTRLQALATLGALGTLEDADVLKALADPEADVRRAAIVAAEGLIAASPRLGEALARLADDPDIRVRFRAALSLGLRGEPEAGRALAAILRRDPGDRWVRSAVLISAKGHAATILASLFGDGAGDPPALVVGPLFALAMTQAGPGGMAPLVRSATEPGAGGFAAWQFAAVAGLLDAAARAGTSWAAIAGPDAPRLDPMAGAARRLIADDRTSDDLRLASARLLGRRTPSTADDRAALASLLRPQVARPLQEAAVAALARAGSDEANRLLLGGWPSHSPTLRTAILDALSSREAGIAALLSAVESGRLPAAEIDPAARRRLLDARPPALRARAVALFAATNSPRAAVIASYRDRMPTAGDPTAGLAVFRRACASCHRLSGEGMAVGPDLGTIADRSREALLAAILDPNRAFEARYTNFLVATSDGRTLSGIVAAETAASVTLRRQDGKDDVILRSEIAEMAGSGRSLMPEGLEKDLTPRDLADLLATLRSGGPPRKVLAGNRPDRVRPGPDGIIRLIPATAEVYGPSLILEAAHANLGYWSSPDDQAAWEFETDRPGRYEVVLDRAVDDASAGNRFVLEVGPARIEGKIESTGSWDAYKADKVGEVTLGAGRQRLEIRPLGPIRGALMDLRAVVLRPAR